MTYLYQDLPDLPYKRLPNKRLRQYDTSVISDRNSNNINSIEQGDTSRWFKPPVDTKTKVAFWYMRLALKRDFCFDVNKRFGQTWCVTLYNTSIAPFSVQHLVEPHVEILPDTHGQDRSAPWRCRMPITSLTALPPFRSRDRFKLKRWERMSVPWAMIDYTTNASCQIAGVCVMLEIWPMVERR